MQRDERAYRIHDRIRYEHILDAATDVMDFCRGRSRAELDRDHLFRRGLMQAIQEIGEAAARISDESRALAPELPWGKIVQTRHIFVHEYYGIDLDTLWKIATEQVPALPPVIQRAIDALPLPPHKDSQ